MFVHCTVMFKDKTFVTLNYKTSQLFKTEIFWFGLLGLDSIFDQDTTI